MKVEAGVYDIRTAFTPRKDAGIVELKIGDVSVQTPIDAGAEFCLIEGVELASGDAEVHAIIRHGQATRGVYQMELRKK